MTASPLGWRWNEGQDGTREASYSEAEMEALHQLYFLLEMRWHPEQRADDSTYFDYDPLPYAVFIPGIREAAAINDGRRFVDLGCGLGGKLAFMHSLGYEVSGVERYAPYAQAARQLCPDAHIEVADVLDLEEPLAADIFYFYTPMAKDEELEMELERHVIGLMEPGAVLFYPFRVLPESLGLTKAGEQVWVK